MLLLSLHPLPSRRGLSFRAGRTQTPLTLGRPPPIYGGECAVVPGAREWFLGGVRGEGREGQGNTDYLSPSPEPPREALQGSVSHFILRFRGAPTACTLGLLPTLPHSRKDAMCLPPVCRAWSYRWVCGSVCVGREGRCQGGSFATLVGGGISLGMRGRAGGSLS